MTHALSYVRGGDRNGSRSLNFGLLLSWSASAGGVTEDFLELIAQDKTKGVFDDYSQEGGSWTFFGDSSDAMVRRRLLELGMPGFEFDHAPSADVHAAVKTV